MAQKINPISFRLGTTQIWNSTLQIYGKSCGTYFTLLHKYLQIRNYLVRYFYTNNFLLDCQEWKIHKNKIFLNIYYLRLPYSHNLTQANFFAKINDLVNQWFSLDIFIRFYLKSPRISTAELMIAYTYYLLEQNTSPKKIIFILCKFLEIHFTTNKIFWFKNGFFQSKLKGFKIRLSGRLDDSKNQIAKSIEQTVGVLPLTCLKSYVEYVNKEIYTKSGICGLQIWLFYEIH